MLGSRNHRHWRKTCKAILNTNGPVRRASGWTRSKWEGRPHVWSPWRSLYAIRDRHSPCSSFHLEYPCPNLTWPLGHVKCLHLQNLHDRARQNELDLIHLWELFASPLWYVPSPITYVTRLQTAMHRFSRTAFDPQQSVIGKLVTNALVMRGFYGVPGQVSLLFYPTLQWQHSWRSSWEEKDIC